MTDKDIKHVIRTCTIRHDVLKHERYLSDVICREYCLPCLRVIDRGQCPKLQELFRKRGNNG